MNFRGTRLPTEITARVQHADGECTTTIKTISRSGITIESIASIPITKKVSLQFLGQMHSASIAWRNIKTAGLKFDKALSPAELATLHRPGSVSQKNLIRPAKTSFHHGFRELN